MYSLFCRDRKKTLALAVSFVALCVATPAVAQNAGAPPAESDLPPVTVESDTPQQVAPKAAKSAKGKTAAKKKPVAQQHTAPVESYEPTNETFDATGGSAAGGGGTGGGGGQGAVDGYLATRTSTATKTDTPLRDIPQSITVVPKELAKDQGSRDMRQALTYVPGVIVGQGEGHRDAPTIRGVSTTADFFTDGIRDDVQYFRDLYNIDLVEVLKGPNAMIFGRGGGGGVINRVTKKADGERIYEVTTTYGSFDTKRVELDAGQAITPDAAFRLNTMYENSGSYRDFVDMERYGINPKLSFRPDADTKVHLSYEFYSDDRTVDRGIPSNSLTGKPAKTGVGQFFGNPDESYMYYRGHVANAIVEHEFGPGLKVKSHTQYGNYEKFYQNVFPSSAWNGTPGGTINLGAYNQITERESIFNQTDLTAKIDQGNGIRHTLLAGLELGYQETDNQRDRASGNYPVPAVPFNNSVSSFVPAWGTNLGVLNHTELSLAGVYVQDQLSIGRYIDLIGGIRFDHFDLEYTCSKDPTPGSGNCSASNLERTDNVWSPRAGVVFKPWEPLSLYASYSKSFLPSSGDQFSNLTGGSATSTDNLQPEEFLNKEIGFKWEVTPRLVFTGALFQLDRENQFVTLPDGVTVGQLGTTRTEGGELTLAGYLTNDWEVVAGYGYQRADVRVGSAATQGKEIALVPRHTFSLWNKYHFLPNWAAGIGVLSRSEMYANINNAVTLPGFTRVDAALFWDISENLKAQLNVENIFDTHYYTTAHSNDNITPGSPQAFYVTLTTNF
jgi:catecholate siderophore receptor